MSNNNTKSKKPRVRKTKSFIAERVTSKSTQIEIDGSKTIKNQFKGASYIPGGGKITGALPMFENIHKCIIQLFSSLYATYGANNIYVLGCLAWFTHPEIVGVLSQCAGVSFIVNDEDFSNWGGGNVASNLYIQLPQITQSPKLIYKNCPSDLLRELKPGNYKAIRCVGTRPLTTTTNEETHNGSGRTLFQSGPIMHSKFFIPCLWCGNEDDIFQPLGVITGSMNPTIKSQENQENMIWLESQDIGIAYLHEYARTFYVSKALRQ